MKSWQLFMIFAHIWVAPHVPFSVAIALAGGALLIAFFEKVLPE